MVRITVIVVMVVILAFVLACSDGQVAVYDEMGNLIPTPTPKPDPKDLWERIVSDMEDVTYHRWYGEVGYIHDEDRGVGIWVFISGGGGSIFVLPDDQYLR